MSRPLLPLSKSRYNCNTQRARTPVLTQPPRSGLIDPSVSSSFGEKEWKQYLTDKILPKGTTI